ncbi:hypothetical protein L9F63_016446, partial [Diploptera punctata]
SSGCVWDLSLQLIFSTEESVLLCKTTSTYRNYFNRNQIDLLSHFYFIIVNVVS